MNFLKPAWAGSPVPDAVKRKLVAHVLKEVADHRAGMGNKLKTSADLVTSFGETPERIRWVLITSLPPDVKAYRKSELARQLSRTVDDTTKTALVIDVQQQIDKHRAGRRTGTLSTAAALAVKYGMSAPNIRRILKALLSPEDREYWGTYTTQVLTPEEKEKLLDRIRGEVEARQLDPRARLTKNPDLAAEYGVGNDLIKEIVLLLPKDLRDFRGQEIKAGRGSDVKTVIPRSRRRPPSLANPSRAKVLKKKKQDENKLALMAIIEEIERHQQGKIEYLRGNKELTKSLGIPSRRLRKKVFPNLPTDIRAYRLEVLKNQHQQPVFDEAGLIAKLQRESDEYHRGQRKKLTLLKDLAKEHRTTRSIVQDIAQKVLTTDQKQERSRITSKTSGIFHRLVLVRPNLLESKVIGALAEAGLFPLDGPSSEGETGQFFYPGLQEKRWYVQLADGRRKVPDLALKGTNKVIEIFGDYWHSKKFVEKQGTPEYLADPDKMIEEYEKIGYEAKIFWERDLRKPETFAKIVDEIIAWAKQPVPADIKLPPPLLQSKLSR